MSFPGTSLVGLMFAKFIVIAQAWVICAVVLCAAWAFGVLIARRAAAASLFLSFLEYLAIGLIAIMTFVAAFGHAGLLVAMPWILAIGAAVFLVIAARFPLPQIRLRQRWHDVPSPQRVPLILIGSYLIGRCLQAVMPQAQGDPLSYHLPSALIWAERGRISMIDWLPWSLQGGTVEYLYTLIARLVKGPIELLISAQVLHAFVGFVICGVVVFRLSRVFLSRELSLWAVFAFVTIPQEPMMLVRAKNDGFVLFFSLMTFLQIAKMRTEVNSAYTPLVFLFSGAALMCKHTAFFAVLPAWTWWLWEYQRLTTLKGAAIQFLAGVSLALSMGSIVWLRNWAWTGNPLFPAMGNVFPSPHLNSFLNKVIRGYSVNDDTFVGSIVKQWYRFFADKPVAALGSIFGGFVLSPLWLVTAAGLFLVAVVTKAGFFARFAFFIYALGAVVGVATVARLLEVLDVRLSDHWKFLRSRRWRQWSLPVLMIALIIPESQIDVAVASIFRSSLPFVFGHESYYGHLSKERPELAAHAWMNKNLTNARILSMFVNECLFLKWPLSVPENSKEASEVLLALSTLDALRLFDQAGFTHVLETPVEEFYMRQLRLSFGKVDGFSKIYDEGAFKIWVRNR